MKRLVIFIFLMSITFSLLAQIRVVKGLIVDEKNNLVSNANISILNTRRGTTTNKNGFFYLAIKKYPATIQISHISYYTKTIKINETIFYKAINDTLLINVVLKPKINLLDSFEVSSEKIKLIYTKPFVSIYDYQFYNNNLLLLLKENKVFKLRLVDDNQQVIKESIAPKNAEKLFKDCFGNIHIVTKDSIYQLNVEKLEVLYSYSIVMFNTLLNPCVSKFNNKLIFNEFGIHNQSILYFYFNKRKEKKYFKKIRNKAAEQYASQEIIAIKYLEDSLKKKDLDVSSMSENIDKLKITREIFQETNFYEKILLKPLYAPLFKINNKVFIFDHINDSCFIYDNNLELQRSFFINYHFLDGWKKQLIVDKAKGEVYAKFEKGGLVYLKKIDLQAGAIIKSYKLEKHTFPTNIKIRNNTVYYLYQNHFNHGQMSLFKRGLY